MMIRSFSAPQLPVRTFTQQPSTAAPAGPAMRSDTFLRTQALVAGGAAPAEPMGIVRRLENWVADMVVALSSVPLLADLGYKLYGAFTRPKEDTPTVGNLGTVDSNLMRGAQPTAQGFAALKAQGVQTIINLRPEEKWEEPLVKAQGLNYVYLPLPAVGAPSTEEALQFLKLVTDPSNGKVFFHCHHGADRTGAMAAAYRIAVQGWTAEQAIAEMPKYGFHEGFEDAKLDFIRKFESDWQTLPPAIKAQTLNRPVEATA